MEDISSRISECIKFSGLTKTDFAKRINLSQPFVSQLTSGSSRPSDRTIIDICKEFGISESWLRAGEGQMKPEVPEDAEVAELLSELLDGEKDDIKYRLVAALSKLDEKAWDALADVAKALAETEKERGD